jgi:hypothetical protein
MPNWCQVVSQQTSTSVQRGGDPPLLQFPHQADHHGGRALRRRVRAPHSRGLHSSNVQLNMSRFGHQLVFPCLIGCGKIMHQTVLTLSRKVNECKPLPQRHRPQRGPLHLGSGKCCSPRHEVPLNSRNEGANYA